MNVIHLKQRGEFYFIWSQHCWRRWFKWWYFRLTKQYESHVYQAALDHYRPGSTIIDAGAFVGIHAISWAHKIDGRVIAFEPVSASYQVLIKNKINHKVSDEKLKCYPMALGQDNQDCHIVDDTLRSHIALAKASNTEPTEMRTLDSFDFDDVSVIKLDVEGYELAVLKGAQQLIARCMPVVIFEHKPAYNYRFMRQPNTNAGIESFLHGCGYRIKKLKCNDYMAYKP